MKLDFLIIELKPQFLGFRSHLLFLRFLLSNPALSLATRTRGDFAMDEERIGLALAKTSELRSKIINCIHKTTSTVEGEGTNTESQAENQDFDDDEEEDDTLLNIKDALESLEGQLSSLQALQQQQWYEKEASLSEIEYSQKKLLKELKEYKGKDLKVIHEAIAFASLTEDNTDLLLPPYPSRPSQPPINGGYLSAIPHRKFPQNGGLKNPDNNSKNSTSSGNLGPLKSFGGLIGMVAKAALTVVGVIAILSLAGKRDNGFVRVVDLFRVKGEKGSGGGGSEADGCPPGKVVDVMENGETRCVVKERVEVPFESVVDAPDVSYGCG